MMKTKTIFPLLAILIACSPLYSQVMSYRDSVRNFDPNKPATWVPHTCDSLKRILDFQEVIRSEFSRVVNGSSNMQIGSFAALDVTKATANFKYTSADNKRSLYTIGASGGKDDDIVNLFSNKKSASNIELEFTGHFWGNRLLGNKFLRFKKRSDSGVGISSGSCTESLKKIYWEEERSKQLIEEARLRLLCDETLNSLEVKCGPCPCRGSDKKDTCYAKGDSIRAAYLRAKYRLERSRLNERIDSILKATHERMKAMARVDVVVIRMQWFSAGASFKNNSFKLLDQSDTILATQLKKQSNNVWSLSLAYNYYHWSKLGLSKYFKLGVFARANDNFSALKKIEITDSYASSSGNATRAYENKFTAYAGNYNPSHLVLGSNVDFFYFLFRNKAAIHVQGDVNFDSMHNIDLNFERPVYNATFGLLLSPIDAKDNSGKSVQNVELFVKLYDLFNGLKYENPQADKTLVGLRFTTPINFKH